MKQILTLFFSAIFLLFCSVNTYAYANFSHYLCRSPSFICQKVRYHQSWESLFHNPDQRIMIMELNRMNTPLYPGIVIAIPHHTDTDNLMAFSPFPMQIKAFGTHIIIVDPSVLAWAAYDANGQLVRWGAASLGSNYCPDLGHRCHSPTGLFHIYSKGSVYCKSSKFPLPHGGAPMPYCMYFHGGFALHGEPDGLPGDNASHGCIRLFVSDAEWLSKNFADINTPVIVEPYGSFFHPEHSILERQ